MDKHTQMTLHGHTTVCQTQYKRAHAPGVGGSWSCCCEIVRETVAACVKVVRDILVEELPGADSTLERVLDALTEPRTP